MTENHKVSGFYLSPYQHEFVENFLNPNSSSNHLLFAPVGSGKTLISSVIVNEMVKSGARRILVLVPAAALLDQYKRFLSEREQDLNVITLNRKVIREIDSLNQKELFWSKSLAIATLQQALNEEIKESILSVSWDLIIVDEIEHVSENSKHAAFVEMIVEKHIASRILILANQTQAISSFSSKRSFLSSYVFEDFETTKWKRKDIFPSRNMRPLNYNTKIYERTKEEIEFIKKYTSLSKWLSNRSFQNKIRSRLVSSSLYAAEESLRNLRNLLVHEDLRSVLDSNDTGSEFIKDEELLGDLNRAQVDRKFTSKDIPKLMSDLSKAFELLDNIQVDSKFNILSQVVRNIQGPKQRTWIYASYQSTISFLSSALSEMTKDVYQIHGQTSPRYTAEYIQRFREDGGFLVSSTSQLKGVDLVLDNLILYDTPENESLIYTIFTRISGMTQEKLDEPVNIIIFDDMTNTIKSERKRLEKLNKFLQQLIQEEM